MHVCLCECVYVCDYKDLSLGRPEQKPNFSTTCLENKLFKTSVPQFPYL